MAFIARAIKSPVTRRDDKVRQNVMAVLRKTERAMLKDFKKTTATWQGETPTFEGKISFPRISPDMTLTVGAVNDGSLGWRKYNWLNKGTSIRWAMMSEDWQSKTGVGKLESGAGSGYVVIAGSDMIDEGLPPMPGIEARDWDRVVRDLHLKEFQKEIKNAIARGMRASAKVAS